MKIKVLLVIIVLISSSFSLKKGNIPLNNFTGYYYPPLKGLEWEKVKPETLGWDTEKLNELINYVDDNKSTAFIILYKGRIVVEKYFRGFNVNSSARIFSATKSMGAFLIGLAQEQGKLTINKKVSDYLGKNWSKASLTQEDKINVKHLITMTSGLNRNLGYETAAGTKWYYNTPAYHKIYEVLAAAYGQNNTVYTEAQLWSKIGMQNSFWDTEPGGGPSMSCSGRDMARFGLMILSEGKWNGSSIMKDQTYFKNMLEPAQTLNPSYGYLWWLNGQSSYTLPGTNPKTHQGALIPNAPADLVAALGFGDKKIHVSKSKDLVLIRHGAPSNSPITNALSNFDNEIWKRLMLAMK